MFSCKQHSENSFPGAYPPVILVLAVTLSQQLSSLNIATRCLKSCLWQQPWCRWQASAFYRKSHLPKRAPPLLDMVTLKLPPCPPQQPHGDMGKRASRQRFATIHHRDLLSHGNDPVNASGSSTNETPLTCCYWLQCRLPGVHGRSEGEEVLKNN